MTDRLTKFRSLPESEGRVLLLINAFSGTADKPRQLEGRLKLAKLDFLVRYPKYLARVLVDRNVSAKAVESVAPEPTPLEDKMIRYRYGPWDPSYYAVLGSLIGRGLVEPIPFKHGIGYRVTNRGRDLATAILEDETWDAVNRRAVLTRRHLDLSGSTLKDLLYEAIPEMTPDDVAAVMVAQGEWLTAEARWWAERLLTARPERVDLKTDRVDLWISGLLADEQEAG